MPPAALFYVVLSSTTWIPLSYQLLFLRVVLVFTFNPRIPLRFRVETPFTQELDLNLEERWLVALWDFWSDLLKRRKVQRAHTAQAYGTLFFGFCALTSAPQ